MQKNYYALVAGLPDILPEDRKLLHTSAQLREMLQDELNPEDFTLAKTFYLPFDHKNLLNLLFDKTSEWDSRGNIEEERIEQLKDRKSFQMTDLDDVPDYFYEFLEKFHGDERIENYYEAEKILTTGYYNHLTESTNVFVKDYGQYDKNIANIMLALNGRKYETSFEDKLIGSDDVVNALKRSRTRDFGLSGMITDIEQIIQIFETENLQERELKTDKHKWSYLDEIIFFNYFTIERVLAFIIKLFIVERWMQLNEEKGIEMFNKLLKELEDGFQFPEEYTLAYGKKK